MRRLRSLTEAEPNEREGGRRPPSRVLDISRAAAVAAAVIAVGACSGGDGGDGTAEPPPAPTSARVLEFVDGEATLPWVGERRLHLAGGASPPLAAAVNATLTATLAPIAVPSRAGDAVAYNSWRGRRPTVRVRDLRSGRETVLDEGAHSVAWAADGSLAYFKALKADVGDPRRYLGHVVVRRSRRAAPRAWTVAPGRYVVAGWARGRLLVYRLGQSFPDLLVVERSGRQRAVARKSALVAVSPDGARAFVSRYGASPPVVRVVDVASGRETARLRLAAADPRYVVESGSWVGDRVFAPTTTGISVFRVGAADVELEQVLRAGAEFPFGLSEPRASADGGKVLAWGALEARPREAIPQAALVECDRVTLRCVRAAVATSAAPPRPLYNPSRP